MQRLKISREGVILIKSFEGFRPRAVRRDDGRWVVGYGHTLSAREGATVTEAEAELLLQYDLVPIAKALNSVSQPLNQNQFDALASFAFSVGLDRFQCSNVLERLTSGDTAQAAEAMVGWTDPMPVISAEHRRATERALFVTATASEVRASEARALAERTASPTLSAPESAAETASYADSAPVEAMVGALSGAASPQRYQAYAAGIVGPLPGPFPANLTPSNDTAADPATGEPVAPTAFAPAFSAETPVADGAALQVRTPLD